MAMPGAVPRAVRWPCPLALKYRVSVGTWGTCRNVIRVVNPTTSGRAGEAS